MSDEIKLQPQEEEMWDECENCGSTWGIGSEEWQFQQCDSCGWMPGQPTDEDDPDGDWEEDDDDMFDDFPDDDNWSGPGITITD